MKPLEKDELFQNLQGFLKTKGVEIKEGSYGEKIQKSCGLLSDAINLGQKGLTQAKVEIDKKLDQLRQVIHEKTARPGQTSTPPKPPPAEPPKSENTQPRGKKRGRRSRKNRKTT